MRPLIFLLKLAWDCRYRLPLLLTVGFMILDVRMQLDINIHSSTRPDQARLPTYGVVNRDIDNVHDDDGESDASWSTFEEQSELGGD